MRRHLAPVLALCMAMAAAGSAPAETVAVEAAFGEIGNGWLFGARSDGACWIALPWHVVAPMEAESATPFLFVDQSGRAGETSVPIRVTTHPAALEAVDGVDDLAFARVTGGRRPADCTDRLGLPEGGFAMELARAARLTLISVQEGTLVAFDMQPIRATTDAERGSRLLLRPVNEADRAFLQGGLSGSVVQFDWQGAPVPAAMVLSVLEDQSAAMALRFDRIRTAFEIIEGGAEPEVQAAPSAGLVFSVDGILADPVQGAAPLGTLATAGGCWRGARPAGARFIEFVLSVGETGGTVAALRLIADPACGPAEAFVIEARPPGGAWETISTACRSAPPPGQPCRIRRETPLDIRLRSRPAQGWLGLSGIALE